MTSNDRAEQPGRYLQRLRQVLVSLAAPVVENELKGASFPAHAEGLVVEFDEAYTHFVEEMNRLPSESQLLALQAVDTKFAGMIRRKDASLWTAQAFQNDPSWSEVRQLAKTAIGECE